MNTPHCAVFPDEFGGGITLRELFVGLAMAGLCAEHGFASVNNIADKAVRVADATLANLDPRKPDNVQSNSQTNTGA